MTRHVTAEMADRQRDYRKHDWRPGDPPSFDQRAAVAKLVGYAEGVIGSGILPDDCEIMLRKIIAETLTAFNMPSKAEREVA